MQGIDVRQHCMDFEIKRIITNEFSDKYISVDLNDLENYIVIKLKGSNFGTSVIKYFWGFELFKFDGGFAQFFKDDITSWKHSINGLVSNSHFDWNTFKNLDKGSALKIMKEELLKSVDKIGTMKKKPKDFNYREFKQQLSFIFDQYLSENNIA